MTKSTTRRESSTPPLIGTMAGSVDPTYVTTIEGGNEKVQGRGSTPEESQDKASKAWNEK